tara:strand:+ start:321 stop:890 length:570 start_codon:yes stop_codon:yes gene_type:complete
MKDNVLKKEFQKKDVKRLRNLIKGKGSERTGQGVGYTKKQEFYKEGDIWEQDGRTWTIRDGIKQNITKLDKFKGAAVPLFCPTCNHIMNKQLDAHYFRAYGACIDCTAKKETKLKLEGKWVEHREDVANKEIDKIIEAYTAFMKARMNQSNKGFITEAGEIEKWTGNIDKEKLEYDLKEGIKYLESLKK